VRKTGRDAERCYLVQVCSLLGSTGLALLSPRQLLERSLAPSTAPSSAALPSATDDVTNADLMNVFRNPNLGLRGDSPGFVAPFHLCCNAKAMVDSSALKATGDGDGGRWER